jgi:hypothetical protein
MQKMHDICEKGKNKMKPLRKWLDEQGIKWTDESGYAGTVEMHFYINGKHLRVIFCGSFYNFDRGLLELRTQNANGGEPLGFLTFDDITELIKKELKTND